MKRIIEYPIIDFYVGELYLYKKFGNLLTGESIQDGEIRIQKFSESGAINFQHDLASQYIDWEKEIEYTGFLTLFYKQNGKYICLHDGKTYDLSSLIIIDNLVLLKDLLPKIDNKKISRISMYDALELFDILFKEDSIEQSLYLENKHKITDFYVGDITLRERKSIDTIDKRCEYINLSHHLMLEKEGLAIHSSQASDYTNVAYKCLFLRDGVDLYNIHNNQFYNPNEDEFESLSPFAEYLLSNKVSFKSEQTTIPKALRLFKRTI